MPSPNSNSSVTKLAKAARSRKVATVRQRPHMPVSFFTPGWGSTRVWWKRQVTLMTFIAFSTIGRGDEICNCLLRDGITWVLQNGSTVSATSFRPGHHCCDKACNRDNCVRGFLILFPSRKNHQHKPSWIPVASAVTVRLMISHLDWLDNNQLPFQWKHMFLPRVQIRCAGQRRCRSAHPRV